MGGLERGLRDNGSRRDLGVAALAPGVPESQLQRTNLYFTYPSENNLAF